MIAESQDEKSLPNRIIYTCSLRYIEKDIVMYLIDKWIQDNCSQDPDIDALLDAADLTRQLIQAGDYEGIIRIVIYTVEKDYYECFSWILDLLQEEFEKATDYCLNDFHCDLGKSIRNYDEFANRLQVDFNVENHEVEKVYDEHGEVESFFNIFRYKTRYKNIYLVSSENFDTKDNDYIQYRLLFCRQTAV